MSLKSQGFLLFEAFVETDTKKAFCNLKQCKVGEPLLTNRKENTGMFSGNNQRLLDDGVIQ